MSKQNNKISLPRKPKKHKRSPSYPKSKSLRSMCKMSAEIINELYNPIDAINRFINLALHSLEEGSQSRQFLIESKQGIRKTSVLLKKLNNYTKRLEQEINKDRKDNE